MAEILKDYAFSRPLSSTYPWDEWLDGQTRRLKRGKDFKISPQSFRAVAQTTARHKGKRLQTKIEDENTIILVAHTKD